MSYRIDLWEKQTPHDWYVASLIRRLHRHRQHGTSADSDASGDEGTGSGEGGKGAKGVLQGGKGIGMRYPRYGEGVLQGGYGTGMRYPRCGGKGAKGVLGKGIGMRYPRYGGGPSAPGPWGTGPWGKFDPVAPPKNRPHTS